MTVEQNIARQKFRMEMDLEDLQKESVSRVPQNLAGKELYQAVKQQAAGLIDVHDFDGVIDAKKAAL